MTILTGVLILCLTFELIFSEESECRNPVTCSCGSKGKNVTICTESVSATEVCSRLSQCQTCDDGRCAKCPESRFCSRETNEKISRQKHLFDQIIPTHGRRLSRQVERNIYEQGSVECSELESPKLGEMRCRDRNSTKICIGYCRRGYHFRNSATTTIKEEKRILQLTCTEGVWTPARAFPDCVSSEEKKPTCNCQNGGSCDSSGQKCVCPAGWTGPSCETKIPEKGTCSDPGFISNGFRTNMDGFVSSTLSDFEAGESVVYICDSEEYALRGSSLLTCKRDGTWSSPLPKCINPTADVQMCPDPGQVANADRLNTDGSPSIKDQQYRVGQSVVYTCRPGFALQRRSLITCLASGAWSFRPPYCTPTAPSTPGTETRTTTFCRDPGTDDNGSRQPRIPPNRRSFPPGSRVVYSCKPGYKLQGEQSIFCLTSGLWSASRPDCKAKDYEFISGLPEISCLNPGPIYNGQVKYYPNIDSRRRPTPDPNEPDEPEYPVGSVLLYSCKPGYSLVGRPTLTCEETSFWSSQTPVCIKEYEFIGGLSDSSCLNPGPIYNGQVVYYPNIDSRRRPTPDPNEPDEAEYPAGSVLLYSCKPGYSLIGRPTLTCKKDGSWSSESPVCIKDADSSNSNQSRTCADPGDIPNGQIFIFPPFSRRREYPAKSRVRYSCSTGYELVGASTLRCQSSGSWSTDPPMCVSDSANSRKSTSCTDPGEIPNGQVLITAPFTRRQNYAVASKLRYFCTNGYTLVGASILTCEGTGDWSTKPPKCISDSSDSNQAQPGTKCTDPGDIPNGQIIVIPPFTRRRDYSVRSQLRYSCTNGYILVGPSTLRCESTGSWSTEPPICITANPDERLTCENPGPIDNGRMFYHPPAGTRRVGPKPSLDYDNQDEYSEGSRLQYTCDEGYQIQGPAVLTCQSNGFWSAKAPECVTDCGRSFLQATRKVGNGEMTMSGDWPWVVSISVEQNGRPRFICGGAVLNSRSILTAAHCLVLADKFILRFGKHHFNMEDDDAEVLIGRSTRVIIHPDYNNVTHDSDIGLVLFEPRIRFSIRIQPICLPTPESTFRNVVPGVVGYVAGWGETEKGLPSDELLLASLPVMSQEACIEAFSRKNLHPSISSNMFCAGYADGRQSVCEGDSGSPYVFYDKKTDRYRLEGIVSFGVRRQCGLPAIFTKVFQFLPWIYRNRQ